MFHPLVAPLMKNKTLRTIFTKDGFKYYYRDVYKALGVEDPKEMAQINLMLLEDLGIDNFEWFDENMVEFAALMSSSKECSPFRNYVFNSIKGFFKKVFSNVD